MNNGDNYVVENRSAFPGEGQLDKPNSLAPNNFQSAGYSDQGLQIPQMQLEKTEYVENLRKQAEQTRSFQDNKYSFIKLVIYAIPIIAVFFIMLKAIHDKEVMWHARQSMVAQGVWYAVLIVLNLISAPLISTYGAGLWNIVMYILLCICGINAYNGIRYNFPVVHEMAKSFIDEE